MQKWEYLTLNFVILNDRKVDKFYENGVEKHPTNKNQLRFEIINSYGALGWELVSVEGIYYTFKRPT